MLQLMPCARGPKRITCEWCDSSSQQWRPSLQHSWSSNLSIFFSASPVGGCLLWCVGIMFQCVLHGCLQVKPVGFRKPWHILKAKTLWVTVTSLQLSGSIEAKLYFILCFFQTIMSQFLLLITFESVLADPVDAKGVPKRTLACWSTERHVWHQGARRRTASSSPISRSCYLTGWLTLHDIDAASHLQCEPSRNAYARLGACGKSHTISVGHDVKASLQPKSLWQCLEQTR